MIEPMGVSQWREYGKKYGYWGFFEKQINGWVVWLLRNILFFIILLGILNCIQLNTIIELLK